MSLTIEKARAAYPLAWQSIEQQLAEVRAVGANIVPLEVRVVEVGSVSTLELIALTDFVVVDDEDAPASSMRFQAPIAEPPALTLVRPK